MSRRADLRRPAILVTLGGIALTALAVQMIGGPGVRPVTEESAGLPPPAPAVPAGVPPAAAAREREIERRFGQAVLMLHAREFAYAVTALNGVLALAPEMPEAHVNMGFAYLGMEDYPLARDFFLSALALRPEQVNAYWGLAVALEGLCDMPGALGAMRSYVHLAGPDDPFLPRARAALWEWQSGEPACEPP